MSAHVDPAEHGAACGVPQDACVEPADWHVDSDSGGAYDACHYHLPHAVAATLNLPLE